MDKVEASDLTGCDALIHLAAVGVSPQKATWEEMVYWNVAATMRLLEQAATAGIKRVVLAGTFAEYGRAADRYVKVPHDAPLLPTYGYAASKAAAFVASHAYAVEKQLEYCYLRIFSAYGEGQYEGNFWPALRKAALAGEDFEMTSGEQIRDYVPVEAVAHAFIRAVERADVLPGVPFIQNVGTGQPISMKQFASQWWERFGASGELKVGALPYRLGEVMRFVPEVTEPCYSDECNQSAESQVDRTSWGT